MDQQDSKRLTPNGSYPSPTSHHHGLPFYVSQAPADQQRPAPTASMQQQEKRFHAEMTEAAQMHTPQQLAQQGLSMNQSEIPGDESGKKKQKVSRACDECRRKKIKCDASEDDPNKPKCANCFRCDAICQFSRAPQKRGPSKGYIKELTERVHAVEAAQAGVYIRNTYQPQSGFPGDMSSYSPSADFLPSESRKRTHSMIEGSNTFGADAEDLNNLGKTFTQTMNGFAPPEPALAFPGGVDPLRNVNMDMSTLTGDAIEEYYRELHTQFPILPNTKADLDSMLSSSRAVIRNFLLAAVNALFQKSAFPNDSSSSDTANHLMFAAMSDEAGDRTEVENTMVLQAALFVLMTKEVSGPGKNETIVAHGFAHDIATHLQLHYNEEPNQQEAKEKFMLKSIQRRLWLILATLERWHAIAMVTTTKIYEENLALHASDRKLLGEPSYQLLRISLPLEHLASSMMQRDPRHGMNKTPNPLIARSIKGEILRTKDLIDFTFPGLRHCHIAYLHAVLLADRFISERNGQTSRVLKTAFAIIHLLANDQNRASPLTHHFAALAAITLGEVLDRAPAEIGPALKLLKDGLDGGAIQFPYGETAQRPAWSVAISRFIDSRLQTLNGNGNNVDAGDKKDGKAAGGKRSGLQGLADAAAGLNTEEGADDEAAEALKNDMIDWQTMAQEGYLKLFE